ALEGGGRVLLLATNAAGSPPAKTVNMWGQCPLLPARPPMEANRPWLFDLLDHDLTRRHMRALPVSELGIDGAVEPLVRLVYLHDRPKGLPLLDSALSARVGPGSLVISMLDHAEAAGQALLDVLLAWLVEGEVRGELDPKLVRSWAAG
ncbi:MAG: hypothetical protein ACF8R7_05365, partial [Phycisphaerales bacterium JB039]